jgi:hypothetical protein
MTRGGLLVAVLALAGCRGERDVPPDVSPPPPLRMLDTGAPPDPLEWCRFDEDADGIADREDGSDDQDADGLPNSGDLDSDADGLEDRFEAGDADPCTNVRRCDEDAFPDFLDLDSDDDGESDADERAAGTNTCSRDTDGDGCEDFAERLFDGCATPPLAFHSSCDALYQVVTLRVPGEGEERLSGVTLVIRDVPGEAPFDLPWRISASGAEPTDGIESQTSSGFTGVRPGTDLVFVLELSMLDVVPMEPGTRRTFVQSMVLLGPGGRVLSETRFILRVQAACILLI